MKNVLISTRTKSWTVASQFSPNDLPVGSVVVNTYALISHNGREPREYQVTPHEGCEGNGFKYTTMEAYSDNLHCTECDLYVYYGIGD